MRKTQTVNSAAKRLSELGSTCRSTARDACAIRLRVVAVLAASTLDVASVFPDLEQCVPRSGGPRFGRQPNVGTHGEIFDGD